MPPVGGYPTGLEVLPPHAKLVTVDLEQPARMSVLELCTMRQNSGVYGKTSRTVPRPSSGGTRLGRAASGQRRSTVRRREGFSNGQVSFDVQVGPKTSSMHRNHISPPPMAKNCLGVIQVTLRTERASWGWLANFPCNSLHLIEKPLAHAAIAISASLPFQQCGFVATPAPLPLSGRAFNHRVERPASSAPAACGAMNPLIGHCPYAHRVI